MPPQGLLHPAFRRAEEDAGRGFERLFGGALVTCGLGHIRQPAGGEPLHGRLPYTPARVTLASERDGLLEVEAEVVEARLGGPVLVLRRRIEAPAGGTTLRLQDEVENAGPEAVPHALLHHVNLGWPLLAPGARLTLGGTPLGEKLAPGDPAARPVVACHPAPGGQVRLDSPEGMALTLRFSLPFLQVWHDLRPGVCVLGLEPCSIDRGEAPGLLRPGERRSATLELALEDAA
jgi:hypothetical protein